MIGPPTDRTGTKINLYEYRSAEAQPGWRPLAFNAIRFSGTITGLRIITYNVWFDKLEKRVRFNGVIRELLSIRSIDVISLQEVTEESLEWLQETPEIQSDWLLTNCWGADHERELRHPNWYGCILLVTKRWAGNVRCWIKRFPTSKMRRFVVMAEVFQNGKSLIRIANAHTDSPFRDVEEREREADVCIELLANDHLEGASTLSSSTLMVLSGDLNTATSSELGYITERSFRDSIESSDLDPAIEIPESATVGITFPLSDHKPRRSDFILYKGDSFRCINHTHFAGSPLKDINGNILPCARGAQGYLYPSDHLAVFAEFERSPAWIERIGGD